eukprot:scaffold3808_cov112-Isochrysis_galbana.AAC.30
MALTAMPRRHPLLRQSARRQMASPLARQRVRISCPHHPHLTRLDPIRTTTSPATTTTCLTSPTSPAPTTAPVGARHSHSPQSDGAAPLECRGEAGKRRKLRSRSAVPSLPSDQPARRTTENKNNKRNASPLPAPHVCACRMSPVI